MKTKFKSRKKRVKLITPAARDAIVVHAGPELTISGTRNAKEREKPVDPNMMFGKKKLILVPQAKTRIGNRKELLKGLDHRDHRVRRIKEIYYEALHDLGGVGVVSMFQDVQAKQLAFLVVQAEDLLKKWTDRDEAFDEVRYMMYTKMCAQIGKQLGLSRYKRQTKNKNDSSRGRPPKNDEEEISLEQDTDETLEDFLSKEARKEARKIRTSAKRAGLRDPQSSSEEDED